MEEKEIGVVVHYWGRIGVAGIEITEGELKVGDTIHIKGTTSDFTQVVESIHLEDTTLDRAEKGQKVGIKVSGQARQHDKVYLVIG